MSNLQYKFDESMETQTHQDDEYFDSPLVQEKGAHLRRRLNKQMKDTKTRKSLGKKMKNKKLLRVCSNWINLTDVDPYYLGGCI